MKKKINWIIFLIILILMICLGRFLYGKLHDSNTLIGSIYKFKYDYDHKNDYNLSGISGLELLYSVPDSSTYEKNIRTIKDFNPSRFDDVYRYDGRITALYNDNGPYYEFDDYGNLKCEGMQINGLEEGVGYCYFDDGCIEYVFNYKNGKRDGITIEYDFDGDVRTVVYYENGTRNGEFIQRDYFDGSIENGYYVDGKQVGVWTGYNPDGSVNYISKYNDEGNSIGYEQYYDYESKQLEYIKSYDNDGKELEGIWYYESGSIKRIDKYGDDMFGYGIISQLYYDENGNQLENNPDSWWD